MNDTIPGQGIRFNDYFFTEPERLTGWVPPRCAGIFAILVKDPNWAPKPFQPIWFGEFGNNAQHLFAMEQPLAHAELFFVSVLPMLFSTTEQRLTVRERLVWAYNPVLNAQPTHAIPSELAHKLQELEKKHEEQSAELRLLLTNASNVADSSASRRRRIGFSPDLEPAG
jgi:hypothetical protein